MALTRPCVRNCYVTQHNQTFFNSAVYPTLGTVPAFLCLLRSCVTLVCAGGSTITILGYYFGNGAASSVNITVGGNVCVVTSAPGVYRPGIPPVQVLRCVAPTAESL